MTLVSPADIPDWDERLVRSGGPYSFFHSSAWAEVLRDTYGYSPCYFVRPDTRSFTVLVPMMEVASRLTGRRGVSLPFSDYCEAIPGDPVEWKEVFEAISEHARTSRWDYVEFRGGRQFPSDALFAFHYGHRLNLERSPERLFSNLEGTVRRNIRKALKEGVEIEISESAESIREFTRLNSLTRKEHGLPPQPFEFFRQIHRKVISRGRGFVILARHGNRPVAGAVFFHIGEKAVYKYGASDRRMQHLRANNLVMWEAVRQFAERGFGTFCFGRTEPGNDGLRRFKTGWGAEESLIPYYRYDFRRSAFISGASGPEENPMRAVFRRLPVFVLVLIGRLLYRHAG